KRPYSSWAFLCWEYRGPLNGSGLGDVLRLRSLLSLHDLELYVVAFLQALVAVARDGAVMHKDIRTVVTTDESQSLGIVEPLHLTLDSGHVHFLRTHPPQVLFTLRGAAVPRQRSCRSCVRTTARSFAWWPSQQNRP